MIQIPVSYGELFDRLSILEIKSVRILEAAQRANVQNELTLLQDISVRAVQDSDELTPLKERLKLVNEALWEIEDNIRACERNGDFGETFVSLARSVYLKNDERADVKRAINRLLCSEIMEEKSYAKY